MDYEEYRREFFADPQPTDELMNAPIRFCYVSDPFGTQVLIFSRLGEG